MTICISLSNSLLKKTTSAEVSLRANQVGGFCHRETKLESSKRTGSINNNGVVPDGRQTQPG
ncbi:MAG TPA: hypothetical protein V6D12_03110 [Candidatus Obscuribacterales bacterium]